MRRDMLALLSTNRANVAPPASLVTRSSDCLTSSSNTVNAPALMSLTNRPFLSCTEASSRTLATSVDSVNSNGSRHNGSLADPLDRIWRLLDSAEQLPIDKKPHLCRRGRRCVLHLRHDPHGRCRT